MRVVAAMSGGVDSSVVAGLLVEQGHDVIGVHMKLHDAPSGAPGRCCGYDDAWDARRVADTLGIPFYVMDLREAFEAAVVSAFTRAYRQGRTPNPCVLCNGVLKFQVLLSRARALGATHLATGHYARATPHGALHVAIDADKDQSYFLFPMTPAALRRTLFPLGELRKTEVREIARRQGLVTADKPESQEICFIPDDDHAGFISRRHPDVEGAGDIALEDGSVVGRHGGYWRFTIGQRRGLGVAVGHPVYVLAIDPITRRVTVGPAERLMHHHIVVSGMNWLRAPAPGEALEARIRHRGARHACAISASDGSAVDGSAVDGSSLDGDINVTLTTPARAGTPGQALVLYAGDEVVGGGWIQRAEGRDAATDRPG